MENLVLYTYCKSSAAYRVRITLNLKKIPYEPVYISLLKNNGENYKPEYLNINPQAMVPALRIGEHTLTQSTAIIEHLEELYPEPSLLPKDPYQRAQARSYAQMVACDIHPLNNLRVLDFLRTRLQASENQVLDWYHNWIDEGFTALESRLQRSDWTGRFCIGDTPGLADAYLVPQVFNAYRYQCDMEKFPLIRAINENCLALDAFSNASPEKQADFEQ